MDTEKGVISMNEHGCYFLTLETVDMLDIFIRPVYKQIIIHTLNHFIDTKGFVVYGWCLTTNRLYLVCQAQKTMLLGDIRKSFKQFTSEKIIEAVHAEPMERQSWIIDHFEKTSGLFNTQKKMECWKKIKDPILIDMRTPENMAEHLELIHNIPVKERFVQFPSDYLYSSARDYESTPGLVKVTKLSPVEQALNDIETRKSSFKSNYKGK